MKKNFTIVAGILLLSLVTNIYYFFGHVESGACDNKDRYSPEETEGALLISETEGRELVYRYRENFSPNQNVNRRTGFVLTKRMFDEIFESLDFNSVTLDLITYNDSLSIVVRGFNSKLTKITGTSTDKVYVIKTFCPIDCSIW